MVGVDGSGEGERQPGELGLRRGEGRSDRIVALRIRERVHITSVGCPRRLDQLAPAGRVGFVPCVDVALRELVEVVHLVLLRLG